MQPAAVLAAAVNIWRGFVVDWIAATALILPSQYSCWLRENANLFRHGILELYTISIIVYNKP